MEEARGMRLDVGAPEYAGEARWRAWGGSCRRRAPDGSPAVPCGCGSPSAPVRGQLEPWEASPAIWVRQALRLDPPIDGETAPAAPPRDSEQVLPGSFDGRWGAVDVEQDQQHQLLLLG